MDLFRFNFFDNVFLANNAKINALMNEIMVFFFVADGDARPFRFFWDFSLAYNFYWLVSNCMCLVIISFLNSYFSIYKSYIYWVHYYTWKKKKLLLLAVYRANRDIWRTIQLIFDTLTSIDKMKESEMTSNNIIFMHSIRRCTLCTCHNVA